MKPRVFIPEPIAQCGIDLLQEHCHCVAPWLDSQDTSSEQLQPHLQEAEAVIVRLFRIAESDLDRAEHLQVIAKHGVGVDNIDCQAASARGIPVVYTPAANANAVAEHTVAMMLALSRQIPLSQQAVREGRFGERSRFQGVELRGKTLGVVGMGRVGTPSGGGGGQRIRHDRAWLRSFYPIEPV